jgi:type II restriction enzyme
LDDFARAIREIFEAEGIRREFILTGRRVAIPGYFRPTKTWDVVVCNGHEIGALIELKSQVGSLGKNFNNRAEEAIGNAKDVRVAHTNNLLGTEKPFLAFFMVIEDSDEVVRKIRTSTRFFSVDPEMRNASIILRWQHLLSRMVREQLYDAACLLPTNRDEDERVTIDDEVGLNRFLASLVGRAQYLALRPGWTSDDSQLLFS